MADNRIVVVAYQFSVVMKSIEKKLMEMGFIVDTVENPHEAPLYFQDVALFIIHLSGELVNNRVKLQSLIDITNQIHDSGKSLIAIGEKKFHEDLRAEVPLLDNYIWVNRPIDMTVFPIVVKEAIGQSVHTDGRRRILVVDDDPSYAKMVREWIKDIYDVDIVTAGMQAITFLIKNHVDLILLDYEMPIVDGPQVLQMLRSEPMTEHIPVIFLTGVSSREGVNRVMALKPSGYVLKSTTKENLLKYLRGILV